MVCKGDIHVSILMFFKCGVSTICVHAGKQLLLYSLEKPLFGTDRGEQDTLHNIFVNSIRIADFIFFLRGHCIFLC